MVRKKTNQVFALSIATLERYPSLAEPRDAQTKRKQRGFFFLTHSAVDRGESFGEMRCVKEKSLIPVGRQRIDGRQAAITGRRLTQLRSSPR